MERIKLDGRLGFSLDLSPEEFSVLTGADRAAAKELLIKLVQSEQCHIVGDTYFPVEWNEDVLNYEMEDNLSFDLPVISFNRNAEKASEEPVENIEQYKEEYLAFLKEKLEDKCNSNMCCEVYWGYRDEIEPSTLREVVDNYKENGFETPKDYLVEKLWERNSEYDDDMFNAIETEIENCDNEHVVEYFEAFGNLREDAEEVGYNGIDVKEDEILNKSEFHINVMFATDAERNFDMGSLVTAFGSWRDPDFEHLSEYPEYLDNALTYFIHQQGHSVKEVYDCLIDNPRGWGSGADLSFAQAIVNDIVNNSSDAMSELTALVKLDGIEFLELVEAVEKGQEYLTFGTNTYIGIFNEWSGTGGLLEFELDKPFVVPTSMVRGVQIEGAENANYSVDSVYGLVGSCWKETLGYTNEAPVLYEEDLQATVKAVREVLTEREAAGLVESLDEVLADAQDRAGDSKDVPAGKDSYEKE